MLVRLVTVEVVGRWFNRAVTLPDSALNRDLLVYARTRAQPATGSGYDLDGWELHVHPDLIERLEDVAGSPKAVVPLYGVVVVVVRDIAVAMAEGTSTLLLRLPNAPQDVELGVLIEPLCSNGWQAVSPWQSDLPSAVGLARLSALLQEAREHAKYAARQRDSG
jgi:hypothetical protein